MLADCFSGFFKKYHVEVPEDGKPTIRDDCPPELFEDQREVDAKHFSECGEHLYTNFEAEEQNE